MFQIYRCLPIPNPAQKRQAFTYFFMTGYISRKTCSRLPPPCTVPTARARRRPPTSRPPWPASSPGSRTPEPEPYSGYLRSGSCSARTSMSHFLIKRPISKVKTGRRRENRDISGPAHPLVPLRTVRRDLHKVGLAAPEDISLQPVDPLIRTDQIHRSPLYPSTGSRAETSTYPPA